MEMLIKYNEVEMRVSDKNIIDTVVNLLMHRPLWSEPKKREMGAKRVYSKSVQRKSWTADEDRIMEKMFNDPAYAGQSEFYRHILIGKELNRSTASVANHRYQFLKPGAHARPAAH